MSRKCLSNKRFLVVYFFGPVNAGAVLQMTTTTTTMMTMMMTDRPQSATYKWTGSSPLSCAVDQTACYTFLAWLRWTTAGTRCPATVTHWRTCTNNWGRRARRDEAASSTSARSRRFGRPVITSDIFRSTSTVSLVSYSSKSLLNYYVQYRFLSAGVQREHFAFHSVQWYFYTPNTSPTPSHLWEHTPNIRPERSGIATEL